MSSELNDVLRKYGSTAHAFAEAIYFEKATIIAPALQKAFTRAVQNKNFDPKQDKIIDIGCGPFLLGLPFLRDGIHVDGVDITPNMIAEAKSTLNSASVDLTIDRSKIKLVENHSDLASDDYRFGMINFVHQCCPDRESLKNLFLEAARVLQPDSHLVLMTTHPDFLHVPHAAYVCSVEDSKKLKDGDRFGGWLYDTRGRKALEIRDDYFWSSQTLQDVAKETGFTVSNVEDIEDAQSLARRKSAEPAYLMMTFRKLPSPQAA